jgi:hypothetical protein
MNIWINYCSRHSSSSFLLLFHHLLLWGWGTWMDGWWNGWRYEWMKKTTTTGQTKDIIYLLVSTRDLQTLWSPPVSLNQERHTQRRKAATFIFYLFIFCDENPLKSPPWKHTWWSEHFGKFQKKKTKSPHFEERKKKRVLKSPHFEEKKNTFWNRWDLWRIWPDSKLSSFETCLWRAC